MKNVKVTIDEETWRASRIEAAKHGKSLSALVRGYLKAMVQGKAPLSFGESAEESAEADRKNREELVRPFADWL